KIETICASVKRLFFKSESPCWALRPETHNSRRSGLGLTRHKGNTANSLIQGNTALQALIATLNSEGIQVTIQSATLQAGVAANAQLTSSTTAVIQIDATQMSAAEAAGQDPTQILYHEADHIYYEGQSGFFQNMPTTTTFSIGGSTYDYNTANIQSGTAGVLTNSPGELAWEHMLIHNDLVSNFGTDQTGALAEGFLGATNPPSNVSTAVSANQSTQGTSSLSINPPPKTASCSGSGPAVAHRLVATLSGYIDSGLTDTY
ncbi:MAG: hypothetical protein ABR949_05210, partial [Candidatus Aquilonibacter sp.]